MDEAKTNLPYDIEIIDFDGLVGIAVEFDDDDNAAAINWAYYYLGKYKGDRVRIWRGHTNPRDRSTRVTEVSSAGVPCGFSMKIRCHCVPGLMTIETQLRSSMSLCDSVTATSL
jgi:hypothetical protein